MRKLAEFDTYAYAAGFHEQLIEWDIEATIRGSDVDNSSQLFSVWVYDDSNMKAAQEVLEAFRLNPKAGKVSPSTPDDQGKSQLKRSQKASRLQNRRRERPIIIGEKSQNFTFLLVGICSILFIAARDPQLSEVFHVFYFSEFVAPTWSEIKRGQLWRLVTPMLLHFSWMHIIFNMMWLYQLGTLIETIGGTRKLVILTLVSSAVSNVFQYMVSGPLFGGMSGVIYAYLAYAWGMGRWQAVSPYFIDKGTFGFMMVWLVLCFTGMFGPVANYSHLGGLVVGLIWALVESGHILKKIRST